MIGNRARGLRLGGAARGRPSRAAAAARRVFGPPHRARPLSRLNRPDYVEALTEADGMMQEAGRTGQRPIGWS